MEVYLIGFTIFLIFAAMRAAISAALNPYRPKPPVILPAVAPGEVIVPPRETIDVIEDEEDDVKVNATPPEPWEILWRTFDNEPFAVWDRGSWVPVGSVYSRLITVSAANKIDANLN